MQSTWRLLNTEQNNAAMNMAIDEAIFLAQKSRPQPTLRFYEWSKPAFSFGYFQRIADGVDVVACASHGIEIVRRMTGGGTVIHGWDLTYTVVVPHGSGVMPKEISGAYNVISECLINGLGQLNIDVERQAQKPTTTDSPNICLANPAQYDVMLNGKKIAGVSQRRNQIGVMYQGYIALDMPPPDVLRLASSQPRLVRALEKTSTAINLGQSSPVTRRRLACAVAAGFEKTLHLQWTADCSTTEEVASAEFLRRTKYATEEWNFRR